LTATRDAHQTTDEDCTVQLAPDKEAERQFLPAAPHEHIAARLIWASLCAAVLKRFLAHAAQLVGGKPISTRRVAMCAGHIIEKRAAALLACVSIASAFRDAMAFLLANARRSNPVGPSCWGILLQVPELHVLMEYCDDRERGEQVQGL
jgi:hypothetical protein